MITDSLEQIHSAKDLRLTSRYSQVVALLPICLLTVIYVLLVATAFRRRLWYDELFTLDIASAASPSRMLDLIVKWDSNPPISYFLSRWSMAVLGHGKLGVRFPSIAEFYTASLFLFYLVRRYAAPGFAALAVTLLWQNQMHYAVEARPYALTLMFFSMLLFFWDRATRGEQQVWSLGGVFLAAVGLALSHVFASLALAGILLAELVRTVRARHIDPKMWAALLLPCAAMVSYIPLFRNYRAVLFPIPAQASFTHIQTFYEKTLPSPLVSYAVLIALIATWRSVQRARPDALRWDHYAFAAYMAAVPIILNLLLMRNHRAFYPRYCLATSLVIYIVMSLLLAFKTAMSSKTAYLAAAILIAVPSYFAVKFRSLGPESQVAPALQSVPPNLPIVDAFGITFFEMNHFESPQTLARLYYLKDRPSAVFYENNTLFEDFEPPDKLDPEFHISGHVCAYDRFVADHDQFLLVGSEWNWQIRRLRAQGATLQLLTRDIEPYSDSDLYLVATANQSK